MDLATGSPRTAFKHSGYSKHHAGECRGAHEATHLPVILFSDGQASVGVDIETLGRLHSVHIAIRFLDRSQRRITYREWLSVWGSTLSKAFKDMGSKETQITPYAFSQSNAESKAIGIDISVNTYGRRAYAYHRVVWDFPPKEGQPYYPPVAFARKCCQSYRMTWSEEKGEAVLQEVSRKKYPYEE